MPSLAENIVKELVDDDNFVNDCKNDINQILADGKFDWKDMPQVISLVVIISEKYDKIQIDEKDIVEVFRLLIIELLKKIGAIQETSEEIEKMLDQCLTLLALKVKTKGFWKRYFGWCTSKCCVQSKCGKC